MRIGVLVASAVGVVGLVSVVGGGPPAGADCFGPTIEHTTGEVGRGEALRVEGERWGTYDGRDECSLGGPVAGIEIVVVQGGIEHPLATVTSADDHTFVVEAPLPADLAPGLADVRAGTPMFPQSYDASTERLVVSDAPPVAPASTTTSTVPAPAPAVVEEESVGGGSGRNPVGVAVVVVVVAALLAVTAWLFARQGSVG